MKAWAQHAYGDGSKLSLVELPEPEVGPYDVLIALRAASLNPVDFKIREGKLRFVLPYRFPLVLGNDGAGVVTRVGEQVTRFRAGDEVYTRVPKLRIGTLAEFIAVQEDAVALKPSTASFEEAAGIPLAGLTAWQALLERGAIGPPSRVFIPAGSGGVGSLAVQIAKHVGAYVATTTSGRNVDFVKSLGADLVLDYTREDFAQELSNYDFVFDTMGGEIQRKALSILQPGGRLVSIVGPPTWRFAREMHLGFTTSAVSGLLGLPAQLRARAHGARYEFLFMRPDGAQLTELARLIDQKEIRPIVDRVFDFTEVREAFAYLETGRARGKVIVRMGSSRT